MTITELRAAQGELPTIIQAMDAARAKAIALEREWHRVEDQIDDLLTAIEDAVPANPAEAAAKLRVAASLIVEGRDPGCNRFLATATLQAERAR